MLEQEFIPIQGVDILYSSGSFPFDLYLNLPLNKKKILYKRKGDSVQVERMDSFLEKSYEPALEGAAAGIKIESSESQAFFCVKKEDYPSFVNILSAELNRLAGIKYNAELGTEMFAAPIRSILSATFNQEDPVVGQVLLANLFQISRSIIERSLEKSNNPIHKKAFEKIVEVAEAGTDFQKHPVNVASLTVLFTLGLGYNSPTILTDVSMAALLHDIGLTRFSPKVISYAHSLLSDVPQPERDLLMRHPLVAMEVIGEKKLDLSDLSRTMILQHHEKYNGEGYPRGIRGYQLLELSQILILSDELDQLFLESEKNNENLRTSIYNFIVRMEKMKWIDPLLMGRIRKILF